MREVVKGVLTINRIGYPRCICCIGGIFLLLINLNVPAIQILL